MIAHPIQSNDFIPLIDEEFDAFSLDSMPGHEWTGLASDKAWDDYPAMLTSSAF